MPVPKDLIELLCAAARIREEERAAADARLAERRRAEEEEERRLARRRKSAGPSAEAILRWLGGEEAAQLRSFGGLTLLGPVFEDGLDARSMASGTWIVALPSAAGSLFVATRLGPAWGWSGHIGTASELTERVPPAILERLARMLADGTMYERLRSELGDLDNFRKEAREAAEEEAEDAEFFDEQD